jgi:hypothetical protein
MEGTTTPSLVIAKQRVQNAEISQREFRIGYEKTKRPHTRISPQKSIPSEYVHPENGWVFLHTLIIN